ncbi:MAG: hypothetical protein Q9159_006901 [Coniocarpon cinnabarinum]
MVSKASLWSSHLVSHPVLTLPEAISDVVNNVNKLSSKVHSTPSQTKRAFTPADDDSDVDTENRDPSLFQSEGFKAPQGTPAKKLKLDIVPNVVTASTLHQANSPTSPLFGKASSTPQNGTFNATSGASSAPAGRSPKHKRIGLLGKKRASMSPFKRVNPPVFGSSAANSLPFSIDAALNGTLSRSGAAAPAPAPIMTPTPAATTAHFATPMPALKVATIEESMPSAWFFNIHEDTPDEEAANIMEHSTGILDISSDDEASPRKRDDRGKENIPPVDHVDNSVNEDRDASTTGVKRGRHMDPNAMRDVGEDRTPLENLNAEDFYGKGLDKSSVEIIKSDNETNSDHNEVAVSTDDKSGYDALLAGADTGADVSSSSIDAATDRAPKDVAEFKIAADKDGAKF